MVRLDYLIHYDKILGAEWFINNRNLFLLVLEIGNV